MDSTPHDYYARLEKAHFAPLWERMRNLVPDQAKPKARPHAWSFATAKPYLLEAAERITAEEAERRVLVLENPGLPDESRITDTIYAGLQILLPGEVAPAHRHTQSALRFVLDGTGAYTSVDGERTTMRPGDFIITPAWTWHDHGSDADGPVIWLDGLDVPLVSFLNAGFREESAAPFQHLSRPEGDAFARYGSGLLPVGMGPTVCSPVFNYPYDRTRAALEKLKRTQDIDPHQGIHLRYANPTNGDWAIPTIATSIRLLPKGFRTRPYKSIEGSVFVVTEGRVRVAAGEEEFILEPKDIFAAPGWVPYTLSAEEESVVFTFSDRPVYEKLGLWREWRGDS